MKTAKRWTALFLSACMLLALLAGCGGNNTVNNGAGNGEDNGEGGGTATYTFTLGHHQTVNSLVDQYCNEVARLVKEKTNGQVELTVYSGAQLGTEQEASDGILLGTQDFTCIAANTYVDKAAGFGVEILPFMASTADELWYIFNETDMADVMNEKLIPLGGRVLSWLPCGGRHMVFVDKEVTSYKQIAGLSMRSPENTIFTGMFEALGASPTPITWSDCYTALQTKVVDGMETPLSSMIDMNFAEVVDYCLLTNHMWAMTNLVVNENVWQSIPEDLRPAIEEAIQEATEANYALQLQAEEDAIAACEEKGVVFHELSAEEEAELPAVFDQMKADWVNAMDGRQEIYDKYMDARAEYAASQQ